MFLIPISKFLNLVIENLNEARVVFRVHIKSMIALISI